MKMLPVILYMFCCLLMATPSHADTLKVVAMHEPPYAYMVNGTATGIAADTVREGLRRLGFTADIKIVPWKRALHMAFEGQADAIFKVVWGEERAKHLYYTEEPLAKVRTIAFRLKGSNVKLDTTYAGAGNLRVGIGTGFLYGPGLDDAIQAKVFGHADESPTEERNIAKLLANRLDLIFADEFPGFLSLSKMDALDEVEVVTDASGKQIVFAASKTYLAFSKKTIEPELVGKFSEILKEMRRDGTVDKIIRQHVKMLPEDLK